MEIQEIILSTDYSTHPPRKYYGCPSCLIEVNSVSIQKRKRNQKKLGKNQESTALLCKHKFGYLGSRPEGIPVPQECFLCSKLLKCI